LSAAERRVLRLISLGKATKEIASELFLSPATVETHRKNIWHQARFARPQQAAGLRHRASG
jgi:DNA-binding CsgD family transcriptional regulator